MHTEVQWCHTCVRLSNKSKANALLRWWRHGRQAQEDLQLMPGSIGTEEGFATLLYSCRYAMVDCVARNPGIAILLMVQTDQPVSGWRKENRAYACIYLHLRPPLANTIKCCAWMCVEIYAVRAPGCFILRLRAPPGHDYRCCDGLCVQFYAVRVVLFQLDTSCNRYNGICVQMDAYKHSITSQKITYTVVELSPWHKDTLFVLINK